MANTDLGIWPDVGVWFDPEGGVCGMPERASEVVTLGMLFGRGDEGVADDEIDALDQWLNALHVTLTSLLLASHGHVCISGFNDDGEAMFRALDNAERSEFAMWLAQPATDKKKHGPQGE